MLRILSLATTAAFFVLMAAGPALPQAQESTAHGSSVPTPVATGAGLPYIPQRGFGQAPADSVPSSRFPGIYVINAGCEQHGDYAKVAVRLYNDYLGPVFLEYGEGQGAVADFTWTGRQLINHGTSDTFYVSYQYKCGANGVRWAIRYVRFGVDSGPYASGEALVADRPPTAPPPAGPPIPRRAHDSPPVGLGRASVLPRHLPPLRELHPRPRVCEARGKALQRLPLAGVPRVRSIFRGRLRVEFADAARPRRQRGLLSDPRAEVRRQNGTWKLRDIRFGTDTGPFVTIDNSGQ